ncbi:hypothetical protein NE850_29330 [Paraburkholderia sp. USG1]|uniref:hypothetical protein n=1 Tax=Paraburkholderia sp. USG1 TaxID=2952268 RepID=UPI00285EF965|nr:hypothetical protein [Paraburkholderia sp. USG1]MDR8400419.1 hypothetical protein [Paraburkholderia sp. USG1]
MKLLRTFTLITTALALASTAYAQSDDTVQTRFGTLAVVSDPGQSKITLNGKALTYPKTPDYGVIEDASSLAFGKKFSIGESDVILVQENSGGTGCPMTYSFVTVSSKGTTITKPISDDHCSDIYKVSQNGNKIVLKVGNKSFTYNNANIH